MLLDHGANVNATDKAGDTLLHLALKYNVRYRTVITLLESNAVVDVANRRGETAIHLMPNFKISSEELLSWLRAQTEEMNQSQDATEMRIINHTMLQKRNAKLISALVQLHPRSLTPRNNEHARNAVLTNFPYPTIAIGALTDTEIAECSSYQFALASLSQILGPKS